MQVCSKRGTGWPVRQIDGENLPDLYKCTIKKHVNNKTSCVSYRLQVRDHILLNIWTHGSVLNRFMNVYKARSKHFIEHGYDIRFPTTPSSYMLGSTAASDYLTYYSVPSDSLAPNLS